MCKSIAEGGLRCASHTRAPYDKALKKFTQAPSSDSISELTEAATRYASTPSGAKAIERILQDTPADSSLRDILGSSLARGLADYHEHKRITADIDNRARGVAVTTWAQQVPESDEASAAYRDLLADDLDLDGNSFSLAWSVAMAESEHASPDDMELPPARFLVKDSSGSFSATPLNPQYLVVLHNFEKLASYSRKQKRIRPDAVDAHGTCWLRYENDTLSEVLRSVDYDPESKTLTVGIVNKDANGPIHYTYRDVNAELVDHMCSARSMGRFYSYVFGRSNPGGSFKDLTLRDFSFVAHISNNMLPTSYDRGYVPKDVHERIAYKI